jgi:hypothetical protein
MLLPVVAIVAPGRDEKAAKVGRARRPACTNLFIRLRVKALDDSGAPAASACRVFTCFIQPLPLFSKT